MERMVEDEQGRTLLIRYIERQKLPFTVVVMKGRHRSLEQNKLQRLWCNEVAEQLGDVTPEWVRGYCKLTIGVPILRSVNEEFRIQYDRILKPLPYEAKLALMQEPLDLPVTRFMTMEQKTDYLNQMHQHWLEQGLVLTSPEGVI